MSLPFQHAHIVAGILVLIVGFVFHWIGQLISVLNWDLATRLGLQEKKLPPEYKVYEHAVAVADASLGWIYGVAAAGLIADAPWGYHLAWVPGFALVYHSISAWVWEGHRRAAGHQLWSDAMRIGWCLANFIAGAMALWMAWIAL
ncbi:MAG: hypothetical protein V2A34_01125 [Lentisphaerota bacterium]